MTKLLGASSFADDNDIEVEVQTGNIHQPSMCGFQPQTSDAEDVVGDGRFLPDLGSSIAGSQAAADQRPPHIGHLHTEATVATVFPLHTELSKEERHRDYGAIIQSLDLQRDIKNSAYLSDHELDSDFERRKSPDLFSLSQVNQQLRRISMPFLFTVVQTFRWMPETTVILINAILQHTPISTIRVHSQYHLPELSAINLSKIYPRRLDLHYPDDRIHITECIARGVSGTLVDPQWPVTTLTIGLEPYFSYSPKSLPFLYSSFPETHILTLKSKEDGMRYHIDDFINGLRCFLSLRNSRLTSFVKCRLQALESVLKLRSAWSPPRISIEAALFWYTSLIAQGVPSLRTFFVTEEYETRSRKEKKELIRRLTVQNTPGGGREVTGDWELSIRIRCFCIEH
ncbi:hypothetical protein BT96DRAFT_1006350 [Gymnopus androsaceus JB14]|uniref:Uncharacterized protein n=1 Tax=Gymnopus androsaceus JB14 TaxID=1447944 RepID=A0A6A4GKD7_9AGAR|nr:hypothetical protein BT96DRAFT_1006350 [Gymnopus androsaceus JB14]